MSLMEKFSNPELFTSLGFGEKMAGSAITMLMGMGITFCVLLLLWGFVALMGKAMNTSNKGDKAPAQATAAATPSATAAQICLLYTSMRDCIYVAASGSEILWLMCRASLDENSTVCGRPIKDRFAETYKIDNGTRRILMVKIV